MQNPNQAKEPFRHFAVWLTALFLTALGAQLWVVSLYGSPIPIWDQWYEADGIFRSWLNGSLTFGELLSPNGNHRILVTRLFDLGFIQLNGRWDPMLQITVNAFLHAAFACGLAFCLWNIFGQKNGWLVCFMLMPFFALPYAGESAIWGIDSLWYFANIFALATLAKLGFAKPGSWQWWCGLAAAVLGLLTMASGLLAPVATGGLILLRAIKRRRMEKADGIGLGVCALLAAAGALMIARPDYIRRFQARTFADFTAALAHNLSWPFMDATIMACVIALPLALLLAVYLRPSFQESRAAELLLALALWSALQSSAIAYGRANYFSPVPPSRYMDVLNVLVIASLFATILLGQLWERERFPKWDGTLVPLVFFGIICFGVCRTSRGVAEDVLVVTREWNLIAEERVQTFMTTGNERDLFERPTVQPDPKVTLRVLHDPKLQTILPAACFPPASAPTPGRLSAFAQGLLHHSVAILSCGLILFVGLCAFSLARGTLGLTARNPAGIVALLAGLLALGFVWKNHSFQRESVEYDLQQQIAAYFKAVKNPGRAAIHEHKAEKLKPGQ